MNNLTVIMYHYVRDLVNTRYTNIKGLDVIKFEKQLEYLSKIYNFVTAEQVIDFYKNNTKLPKNPLLLTFDDGYKDCYTYALPILEKYNAKGVFFIPSENYESKKVLDVNKIHFILDRVGDNVCDLIADIEDFIILNKEKYKLDTYNNYYEKYAHSSQWDTKEVIFVKRILQKGLPKKARKKLCSFLFAKYVDISENVLFEELYLSINQIKFMKKLGHYIGFHTHNHEWLADMNYDEQIFEFEKMIKFFKEQGIDSSIIAYPYGSYNVNTLKASKEKELYLGFTTEQRVVNLDEDNRLALPRFDTNDFYQG